MKRIISASTLALSLIVGSTALAAGPDHNHNPKATDDAKPAPTFEDLVGKIEIPELFIGSKAPALVINKFLNGEPIEEFEEGQVYVVEFWATWCAPCVKAFPHLSELQAKYADDLRIIGVNIWERTKNQAERNELIETFVADQGDRMSYTVAIEDGSAMADTWMKPANQNGIPAAFIVDGTGHIAWIGHPAGIDQPLQDIIDGNFDSAAATQRARNGIMVSAGMNKFMRILRSGKNLGDARQIANILIDDYANKQPATLNAIAWMLLTAEAPKIGQADFKVAHRAIAVACEQTGWEDWSLLDTYALAAYKIGQVNEAIKWQRKAIELTPPTETNALKELKGRLKEYEGQG